MALDDDIGILAGVDIFGDLTRDQLRLLAFGSERLRITAGRELFPEGAAAECAFVVANGSVALFRDRDGTRAILSHAGRGAIIGELALIAETRRSSGAVAETDCELIRLSRTLFRRMLDEYPEVAAALHRRLSASFAAMVERIDRLAPRFR